MPCSGCSALHGVNPDLKKKKGKKEIEYPENEKSFLVEISIFQSS